jgi:uncharacterized protein (TIGR00661 family)
LRIVYGVHGYGRGHAMRTLAVLPELTSRHDVLIFAGGDAYDALAAHYQVFRIPTLRFHYTRRGRLSNWLTLKRNLPAVLDWWLRGPTLQMLETEIAGFGADVVVTDSEGYTHRAAQRLGIPRISFDHFGVLVYCKPAMSRWDSLRCRGNAFVYRTLFGEPDRVVVSSFFDAPAARKGVIVVGPVIRDEVQRVAPTTGDYVLVYLSNGAEEFIPQLERALTELDLPVRVYNAPRQGRVGQVEYKPIANIPFVEDLAGCRAVVATTGNQLLGEVVYFQKPILGMPIECLEQRLNAAQIERMGIGCCVPRKHMTADVIRTFLSREGEFRNAFTRRTQSAAEASVEAIERFAQELAGRRGKKHPTTPAKPGQCTAIENARNGDAVCSV